MSKIDEGLYNRQVRAQPFGNSNVYIYAGNGVQLYVLGHDAQRRMAASDVLVCGLRGVGVETGKWYHVCTICCKLSAKN